MQQRIAVCQQVAKLVRAKLPIAGKLGDFAADSSSDVRELAKQIDDGAAEGKSLANLLAPDDSVDSRTLRACIEAGERTNELDATLQSWSGMHIANNQSTKRLRSAMLYPAMLIVVTVVSLGLVIWKLVPQYRATYELFEYELPDWLAAIVWVREQFGPFAILLALLLLLPLIVWFLRRRGLDSDGLPKEKSRRLRQQALGAELASILVGGQVPLNSVVLISTQATGAQSNDIDYAFERIQKRDTAVPHARESSMLLSTLHAGLITSEEAEENLLEVASHLRQSADLHSRSQARWLPMLVALTVGLLTIATYVFLIYLPWVWLLRKIVEPLPSSSSLW